MKIIYQIYIFNYLINLFILDVQYMDNKSVLLWKPVWKISSLNVIFLFLKINKV